MAKRTNFNDHAFFTITHTPPKYEAHHAEANKHFKSLFLHGKPNDVMALLQAVQQVIVSHPS